MKILVTGGCGYKGSVLIPKLLKAGHEVTSLDTNWFGNYLENKNSLTQIKGDIRDLGNLSAKLVLYKFCKELERLLGPREGQ